MTTNARRIGVVLAGSGYLDGSELQEAILVLLALDRAGAKVQAFAPDREQADVVDHLHRAPAPERRSALVEAARLVRGAITPLARARPQELDGLVIPGGYGVAKTLCTFATDGARCQVLPELDQLVRALHAAGKPQGFVCIAPVVAARCLGPFSPELTIGDEEETAQAIEAMGGRHVVRAVDEIAVDEKNRLVSTPAWMKGPSIAPIAVGIDRLVGRVLAFG